MSAGPMVKGPGGYANVEEIAHAAGVSPGAVMDWAEENGVAWTDKRDEAPGNPNRFCLANLAATDAVRALKASQA